MFVTFLSRLPRASLLFAVLLIGTGFLVVALVFLFVDTQRPSTIFTTYTCMKIGGVTGFRIGFGWT